MYWGNEDRTRSSQPSTESPSTRIVQLPGTIEEMPGRRDSAKGPVRPDQARRLFLRGGMQEARPGRRHFCDSSNAHVQVRSKSHDNRISWQRSSERAARRSPRKASSTPCARTQTDSDKLQLGGKRLGFPPPRERGGCVALPVCFNRVPNRNEGFCLV